MFSRRKRIPLDPPGSRSKRRSVPLSPDRLFINRRALLLRTAVVGSFSVVAGKLGHMQVIERPEWVRRAQGNIQDFRSIKADRGLIFDRAGRPVARNETAFAVVVVPANLPPRDTPERRRVLDTLIAELNLPESLVVDHRMVPMDQKDDVYYRIAKLRGRTEDRIDLSIQAMRQAERINYLVLLEDELTTDTAAQYRAAARGLPGLLVMNYLEYLLGNAPSVSAGLVVKRDVPRDVALRLEANKLHLPGVEIDSGSLVRRYPAGPVMSHLLGFVGPISEAELDANLNPSGNPIYQLDDQIGKDGLEFTMEEVLRGRKGGRRVFIDPQGVELGMVPGSEALARDPAPGNSLKLTIDLELQAAATRALKSYIDYSNDDRKVKGNDRNKIWSKSGAVVAMDPRNGEVLALVSYPQYDNQLFVDGISERKWEELQDEESGRPYFNRAIASSQPPGSTLKCFLAAAGLMEETLSVGQTYRCTGAMIVPLDYDESKGNPYVCWNKEGHGPLELHEAIKSSCDIFFYNVGTPQSRSSDEADFLRYYDRNERTGERGDKHYFEGLGIEAIFDHLRNKFWFGQPTEFELPGEMPGVVPNDAWLQRNFPGQYWSAGDTIITSIGQGYFESTPLQLAVNTCALANGGFIYKPMLVKEVIESRQGRLVDDDVTGETTAFEPTVMRELDYAPEHLEPVQRAMRGVVHEPGGSCYSVMMADYSQANAWPRTNPDGETDLIEIAGKTGTAEVGQVNPDGTYDNQHAWFTCYAPYENPEIVVTVLVEYGGEGANYAAPVADVVLRAYFELTGRREREEARGDVTVGVLRTDKQPVIDLDSAEGLNWFKAGETFNAVGVD